MSETSITRNLRFASHAFPTHGTVGILSQTYRAGFDSVPRASTYARSMWPFHRNLSHRIRSSGPYWLLRNGTGDARPALDTALECDIAIIGAGITGVLIADALVATGQRIVILDSRDVALGSTAATTALLQYEIDTHLTDLVAQLGADAAARAYLACAASFDSLERRFPELLKASNYRRVASLYLAHAAAAVPTLHAEVAARRALGFHCDWLEEAELVQRFGCRRPGAILSALGAQIDPVRFTQGLVAGVERHGVRLFARSRVSGITENGARLRLATEGGAVVDAAHVVIAAGFESLDFLPRPLAGMANIDNTYALVTEPLADRSRALTMPLIWESARPYVYLRGTPDGRLILGGADVPFKNPAARDALLPRQIRRLASNYRDLFGEELPPIAHAWAGSFASTPGGLPFIGRAPGMHPALLFALCYGGNGITYSVHAGEMIRAAVEGRVHEFDDIFGFAGTKVS
jgi:glycine/D-amino acid oxidase-like deaminating enzyme